MNEQNRRKLRARIKVQNFLFLGKVTGPILIVAVLWYVNISPLLQPADTKVLALWYSIQPYFWIGLAVFFGVGVWAYLNLFTPKSLNRMNMPKDKRRRPISRPSDLDEEGVQIWELLVKITTRQIYYFWFIDTPVFILIALYTVIHINWFPVFIVIYSLVVGVLFWPRGQEELIEAALKARNTEKLYPHEG